jgi:hypothetical protein
MVVYKTNGEDVSFTKVHYSQVFVSLKYMRFFRVIVSVFLVIVMMVVTIGVTVNVHYCAGKVRSIALYVKADACQDEQSCHDKHGEKKQGCCAEKTIVIKEKDSGAGLKRYFQHAPAFKLVGHISPITYIFPVLTAGLNTASEYSFYRPPLLHQNSVAFLQSFRI